MLRLDLLDLVYNPSQSYVNSKKKAAEKIGMISEIVHLDETATEAEVLGELKRLNEDETGMESINVFCWVDCF